MNKIEINIGLNTDDNTEPKGQLARSLYELTYLGFVSNVKVERGEYNNIPERTLVATIERQNIGDLHEQIVEATTRLKQQCIAYKLNGDGIIAFNPTFSGEEISFNPQYFITL